MKRGPSQLGELLVSLIEQEEEPFSAVDQDVLAWPPGTQNNKPDTINPANICACPRGKEIKLLPALMPGPSHKIVYMDQMYQSEQETATDRGRTGCRADRDAVLLTGEHAFARVCQT